MDNAQHPFVKPLLTDPEALNNLDDNKGNTSNDDGPNQLNRNKRNRNPSPRLQGNEIQCDRLVSKSGHCKVINHRINNRKNGKRFSAGLFTTMVDSRWRWTLFFFFTSFYTSWLVFAFIYWFISYLHGDFQIPFESNNNTRLTPCLDNIQDFTSIFLFSLETQTTIGFGFSRVTEQCPPAIMALTIQVILGVIIEAFVVGVVFAKLIRPRERAQAITFSRFAVVSLIDGKLSLMFRIQDRHRSPMIASRIRVQLIQSRTTREGLVIPFDQYQLKLNGMENGDVFLGWPLSVIHSIDADSPLFHVSADHLRRGTFEIVVTVEGTIASTNLTTQAVTSYVPSEIQWGYRFADMLSIDKKKITVDKHEFDNIYRVETPLCSSAEYMTLNK